MTTVQPLKHFSIPGISLLPVLIVVVLSVPLPLSAQEDFDNLYMQGKQAFDREDYVTAYADLTAYWYIMRHESQKMGLPVDETFYMEVIKAAQYSQDRINGVISRVGVLEQSESKCRAELAGSTTVHSTHSPLKSPPPPKPPLRNEPPGRAQKS